MKEFIDFIDYIANHPGIMAMILTTSAVVIYRKYLFKQLYLDLEKRIHHNIRKHTEVSSDVDKQTKKALKSFEHISEGKILFCEVMYLRYYFEEEWHIYDDDSSMWIPDFKEYPHNYKGNPIFIEKNGCRVIIANGIKRVEYFDKPLYALHALKKLRRELVHFSVILTLKSIYWYYIDRDFKLYNKLKHLIKYHT